MDLAFLPDSGQSIFMARVGTKLGRTAIISSIGGLGSLIVLFTTLATTLTTTLATTFVERPIEDSVYQSNTIVRGTPLKSAPTWQVLGQGKRITTITDLKLTEVIKAEPSLKAGQTIKIRVPGGQMQGVGLEIPGAPKFEIQADNVVFLGEKDDQGIRDVLGLMMGKFEVVRDQNGEESLSGPGLGYFLRENPGVNWTLADLRDLVKLQKDSDYKPPQAYDSPPKIIEPHSDSHSFKPQPGAAKTQAPSLHHHEGEGGEAQSSSPIKIMDRLLLALAGLALLYFLLRPFFKSRSR